MAKKVVKKIQFWGVGRRKKAIARVRLIPGGENGIVVTKTTLLCTDESVILP